MMRVVSAAVKPPKAMDFTVEIFSLVVKELNKTIIAVMIIQTNKKN